MAKYFSVIVQVENGMPRGTHMNNALLETLGYGTQVPAGFYKTFWVRASTVEVAEALALDKAREHCASLVFIQDQRIEIDSVYYSSLWDYFRNKNRKGATFYLCEEDESKRLER